MKYLNTLLPVLLLLLVAANSVNAIDWHNPAYSSYQNYINVSVKNWNYVQYSGNYVYNENPADFVMVAIPNVLNISSVLTMKVRAFGASGLDQGNVTYDIVSGHNGTITIIFRKYADNGALWNHTTIFYNPTTIMWGTSQPGRFIQGFTTYPGYNSRNYTLLMGAFAYTSQLVVLANHNLTNIPFNLTFYPDGVDGYNLYSNGSHYALKNCIGCWGIPYLYTPGATLTADSLPSGNAQFIFNNSNDDFEAYLSLSTNSLNPNFNLPGNEIVAESLIANQTSASKIVNLTTFLPTSINFNAKTNQIFLNITTSNSISFVFMPAFTRNVTITGGNQTTKNPAPTSGPTGC